MAKTLLGIFAVLLPHTAGAARGRHPHKRAHRPPVVLSLPIEPENTPAEKTEATLKRILWLGTPPSFLELHAAAVHDSLIEFEPNLIGITPMLRGGSLDADRGATNFVPPARTDDLLEQARQRNFLQYGAIPSETAAFSATILFFFALTLMSIEAPRRYRKIFYGRFHVAPATFDGGAMGLGLGGPLK